MVTHAKTGNYFLPLPNGAEKLFPALVRFWYTYRVMYTMKPCTNECFSTLSST